MHRILISCLALALVPSAQAESTVTPLTPDNNAPTYYVDDIKAAMLAHVAANVDSDGVFHVEDGHTGEKLALRFVKIHDPVRRIDGTTYFACTDFVSASAPEKVYDLDFWMNPVDGKLSIYDTKVHKEPRRSLVYGWYKYPRYTFIDDQVVYLY